MIDTQVSKTTEKTWDKKMNICTLICKDHSNLGFLAIYCFFFNQNVRNMQRKDDTSKKIQNRAKIAKIVKIA